MTPTTEEGQDVVLYGADKIIDFIIPTKSNVVTIFVLYFGCNVTLRNLKSFNIQQHS
jgi:hypothetical protein